MDPTTHVILFKDGGKKYLNKNAYDVIWGEISTGKKEILINGSMISVAMIGELISIEEFYQQHPDERPEIRYPEMPGIGARGVIVRETNIKNLKSIEAGLQRYIDSDKYQGTKAPLELLLLVQTRILENEDSEIKAA